MSGRARPSRLGNVMVALLASVAILCTQCRAVAGAQPEAAEAPLPARGSVRSQPAGPADWAQKARTILKKVGRKRGLAVVLEDTRCRLALALARNRELTLFVQLSGKRDVEAARRIVDEAGYYGTRVYGEQGDLSRIHLADNLADLLVAPDAAADAGDQAVDE